MVWAKVGLGIANFSMKTLSMKLCQLTKYQDQNFTLPDIKEPVFLTSSLGTWACHKLENLSSINFFFKISNGHERKKEGKSELQKFDNLEEKMIFFGRAECIFDGFLNFYFGSKNENSG